MNDEVTASVLAAEKRRVGAMLAQDMAALDALLDGRLCFAHATGAVDDKAAYLAKVGSGRIAYDAITWREERVVALGGEAAVLAGRMLTVVQVEGIEKQLDNRVTSVWSRNGDAWRLVAFQSTPVRG